MSTSLVPQPTCCQFRCLYMSWAQTCGLPRLRPCPWRTCSSPEDCPWAWTCLPECLPRLISASAVDPLSQQYQEFLYSLSTCLSLRSYRSKLTCEGCHPDLQAYAWCGYLQILGKRQQRQASPKVHFSAKPVISSDLSDQRWGTLSLRKKNRALCLFAREIFNLKWSKLSSKLLSSVHHVDCTVTDWRTGEARLLLRTKTYRRLIPIQWVVSLK